MEQNFYTDQDFFKIFSFSKNFEKKDKYKIREMGVMGKEGGGNHLNVYKQM